jgi:hypothetical protein
LFQPTHFLTKKPLKKYRTCSGVVACGLGALAKMLIHCLQTAPFLPAPPSQHFAAFIFQMFPSKFYFEQSLIITLVEHS